MDLPGSPGGIHQPERQGHTDYLLGVAPKGKAGSKEKWAIFRGCAAGSAKGEGVFTDRSFGFKPNVL